MEQTRGLDTGKLSPELLARLVLPHTGAIRPEVLVRPAVGEDCGVLDLANDLVVLSTDPITGALGDIGRLAVHVSCNDVAAAGAEPVGMLVTLLVPAGSREEDIARVMSDVSAAASSIGVEVLGGHTEVTSAVVRPLVCSTVVGRAQRGKLVTSSGVRPGDVVMLTKSAGLEGASILASDLAERLAPAVGLPVLEQARRRGGEVSVVAEALVCARLGASAMHDATEGGVLGALYEMSLASGVGLEVDEDAIPVDPATRLICSALGIDPLRLVSSGCLVVTAAPGVDEAIRREVGRLGIPITCVGRAISGRDSFVKGHAGRRRLEPPARDELYAVIDGEGRA